NFPQAESSGFLHSTISQLPCMRFGSQGHRIEREVGEGFHQGKKLVDAGCVPTPGRQPRSCNVLLSWWRKLKLRLSDPGQRRRQSRDRFGSPLRLHIEFLESRELLAVFSPAE